MTIFMQNEKTGLQCGINDYGELFLGDKQSGYNLPDTAENRIKVIRDFNFYNMGV